MMTPAVMTEALRRAGIDPEQVEREMEEQRKADAAAREATAREHKILKAQRRREGFAQHGRDAINAGRVQVFIDGKPVKNQKAACCPHCGNVPAELARLIEDCGRFVTHETLHANSPLQPLNFSGTHKRWVAAPAIRSSVSCQCGGGFMVSIAVMPA